jgi:hypothetical protein
MNRIVAGNRRAGNIVEKGKLPRTALFVGEKAGFGRTRLSLISNSKRIWSPSWKAM